MMRFAEFQYFYSDEKLNSPGMQGGGQGSFLTSIDENLYISLWHVSTGGNTHLHFMGEQLHPTSNYLIGAV